MASLHAANAVQIDGIELVAFCSREKEKAEKLLVDAGHTKPAIAMYAKLFKSARKPGRKANVFARQTSYYILGERLAGLLEGDGQEKEAQKIRKMIKR